MMIDEIFSCILLSMSVFSQVQFCNLAKFGGGGPTLFLSVDFVNILPKTGGGQTLMFTKALTKFCYYTTFQPVQTKRGVSQVFKNIPNHSLCDLHTIFK